MTLTADELIFNKICAIYDIKTILGRFAACGTSQGPNLPSIISISQVAHILWQISSSAVKVICDDTYDVTLPPKLSSTFQVLHELLCKNWVSIFRLTCVFWSNFVFVCAPYVVNNTPFTTDARQCVYVSDGYAIKLNNKVLLRIHHRNLINTIEAHSARSRTFFI